MLEEKRLLGEGASLRNGSRIEQRPRLGGYIGTSLLVVKMD
jgi:hypothetical protein